MDFHFDILHDWILIQWMNEVQADKSGFLHETADKIKVDSYMKPWIDIETNSYMFVNRHVRFKADKTVGDILKNGQREKR